MINEWMLRPFKLSTQCQKLSQSVYMELRLDADTHRDTDFSSCLSGGWWNSTAAVAHLGWSGSSTVRADEPGSARPPPVGHWPPTVESPGNTGQADWSVSVCSQQHGPSPQQRLCRTQVGLPQEYRRVWMHLRHFNSRISLQHSIAFCPHPVHALITKIIYTFTAAVFQSWLQTKLVKHCKRICWSRVHSSQ